MGEKKFTYQNSHLLQFATLISLLSTFSLEYHLDNLSTYGGHPVDEDEMYQVWVWLENQLYDSVLKGLAFPKEASYDSMDMYDFIALTKLYPGEYFLMLTSMANAITSIDCRYVWVGSLITIYKFWV